MILTPRQYQQAYGNSSSEIPELDSGLSDESFRWKDGGKVVKLYSFFFVKTILMHQFLFSKSCTIQVQKYKSGK